jgi:transcriptional regulator with XRE-family HTH domain
VDVADLRLVAGWSQSDLAVALGWSRQKVQRYEAGEDVPLTAEDRVRLGRLRLLAERKGSNVSTIGADVQRQAQADHQAARDADALERVTVAADRLAEIHADVAAHRIKKSKVHGRKS